VAAEGLLEKTTFQKSKPTAAEHLMTGHRGQGLLAGPMPMSMLMVWMMMLMTMTTPVAAPMSEVSPPLLAS